MDEKEELELENELQWVYYRQKMLDIMEGKLLKMRKLADQAKEGNLTLGEIKGLNTKLNNLAAQVRVLDSESRRIEAGKILE